MGIVALYLASVAFAASSAPKDDFAYQTLKAQCVHFAADPKNPWALAHGITGLGPRFLASDGRTAASVIIHDFLLKNPSYDGGTAHGGSVGFLKFSPDGTPVEPHPNLLAKTLVHAGMPLSTAFDAGFGRTTLQALVTSAREGFRHVPQSPDYWRDVAWTLDLFSSTTSPLAKATFLNASDQPVTLDAIMDDAMTALEQATDELRQGLASGKPSVPKRRQGIYAQPCGGLHLVQAVLGWARHKSVRKAWGARVDQQIEILFYRLESERALYEEALAQAPGQRLRLRAQELKFYGHWLETTGRLKRELGWKPTAGQRVLIARAQALLDHSVRQLESLKAFESMAALKTSQPQVYLDLIGDACHGVHGLEFWR